MTHDEAAVRQPGEKARENSGEIRPGTETISSCESRIGCDSQPFCLSTKADAQDVKGKAFVIVQASARFCAPALSHPGVWHFLRHNPQKCVAYLGKQMNVLVPIKEIRRSPEDIGKRPQLAGDLRHQKFRPQAARCCIHQEVVDRQKPPVAKRRKTRAQRLERRRKGHVQSDSGAFFPRVEPIECRCFAAVEMRRADHDRYSVDASASDEFADGGADPRRNSVVIGAQPDVARAHSLSYSAARDVIGRGLADSLARFTLCSATK